MWSKWPTIVGELQSPPPLYVFSFAFCQCFTTGSLSIMRFVCCLIIRFIGLTEVSFAHMHTSLTFGPFLPVVPGPFARLPCLLRQKLNKIKGMENVARVIGSLT